MFPKPKLSLSSVFQVLLYGTALSNLGCFENGGSTDSNTGGAAVDCDDYKAAYCNYTSSCASGSDYASCYAQLKSIECKSSAPIERCVDELGSGCDGSVAGCDISDIADGSGAMAKCDRLIGAYCRSLVECSIATDVLSCTDEVELTLDCTTAYGTTSGYDVCLSALEDGLCVTSLPDSCAGVILLQ